MEISCLPISLSQKAKLTSMGYTTLHSLSSLSPHTLAQDLNISQYEALEILKAVSQSRKLEGLGGHSIVTGAQTAWDMLCEEQKMTHITTSCEDLDTILDGGIKCKEITEVGGVPGIGKTQLGIQLAVNVQIPFEYGGLGGKTIYVDTEGSFMAERAFQIAEACIKETFDGQRDDFQTCQEKMHPNTFLASIFYFRVCSYTEQIAVVNYLDKFIQEQKDVKLVIIDSITFHFRQDFGDLASRTRVLNGMALKLMKLAKKFSLAVVLLNQVTTKLIDGSFQLTLALGFFLNPRFQYQEGFVYSDNIRSGVTKVIERLAPDVAFAIEATREVAQFRGKIGRFGDLMIQTAVGIMNPGDSWSHACTNRIILYWNGNQRFAYLDKSPSLPSATAPFSVTPQGIRNAASSCKRIKMM